MDRQLEFGTLTQLLSALKKTQFPRKYLRKIMIDLKEYALEKKNPIL